MNTIWVRCCISHQKYRTCKFTPGLTVFASSVPLYRLNIYDFQRIQHGKNKDGYCHRNFVRGKPELCHSIVRVFVPTRRKRGNQSQSLVAKQCLSTDRRELDSLSTNCVGQMLDCHEEKKLLFGTGVQSSATTSCKIFHPMICKEKMEKSPSLLDGCGISRASLMPEYDISESVSLEQQQNLPGSQLAAPNLMYKDMFAGNDFFSVNAPVIALAPSTSCQSFASCGSTASSILSPPTNHLALQQNAGTSLSHDTADDIEDFLGDLFSTTSLENVFPLSIDEEQTTARSISVTSRRNVSFELIPSQHRNSLVPSRVSSSSSSTVTSKGFHTISQNASFVSSDESMIDWPGLKPTRDEMLSLANSTSGPAALIKNEDLTRSESVFPTKLHRMLQDANREGFHHIVSWVQSGTAFKVHDLDAFMEEVMTKYFDQSKFQSFRRQLNLYDFTRVNSAVHGTYYFHKCFLQHDPRLCSQITRPKTKRRSLRS